MKKIANCIRHTVRQRITRFFAILAGTSGEGFVDTAVKILISIVIGALLMAGLYTLFGETILPTLTEQINDMFNYGG